MQKLIKAISALHYRTAAGAHLVEPQTTVALDEDLADAFIASGDAVAVATPVVTESLPIAVEPTETSTEEVSNPEGETEVESVAEEAPHQSGPKFGKRGR